MSEPGIDAMSETGVQGRSWDLSSEYPAADSPEIEADLAALDALLEDTETQNATLTPLLDRADGLSVEAAREAVGAARAIHALTERAVQIVHDTEGYAECSLSVDSEDEAAQRLLGRLQSVQKRFANATEPLDQFLNLAPDDVVETYLAHDATAPSRFAVEHARKRRHELLPLDHETLVNSLGQDGIHAWGRLYDQLSGTLTCEVPQGNEVRTMGIAQASGTDARTRRSRTRSRLARDQRRLGRARRVLRRRDQRHRRLALGDVPTAQRWSAGALPRCAGALE